MAFAGMNMANMVGGINAGQLYQMDAQQNGMGMQQAQAAPVQGQAPKMQAPVLGWTCSCGAADNRGKFCSECGSTQALRCRLDLQLWCSKPGQVLFRMRSKEAGRRTDL